MGARRSHLARIDVSCSLRVGFLPHAWPYRSKPWPCTTRRRGAFPHSSPSVSYYLASRTQQLSASSQPLICCCSSPQPLTAPSPPQRASLSSRRVQALQPCSVQALNQTRGPAQRRLLCGEAAAVAERGETETASTRPAVHRMATALPRRVSRCPGARAQRSGWPKGARCKFDSESNLQCKHRNMRDTTCAGATRCPVLKVRVPASAPAQQ